MNKYVNTCELKTEDSIKHSSEIKVRYVETDAMGIVHHSNYIIWFEAARIELFDSLGMSYREFESLGYSSVVTQLEIQYIKPARFDDRLIIHTTFYKPTRIRFYIEYEIRRLNDLLATGKTEHVFMSKDHQVIKPPKEVLNFFK